MALRRGRAAGVAKEFETLDTPALVVVGLGNPGAGYEKTRHNLGWEVIDALCRRGGVALSKAKEKAMVGAGEVDGVRVALAKPTTYMNDSGVAVRALLKRFGVGPEHLVVVYDDIDLAFGRLRDFPPGRGSGGHQGINSLMNHLHTKDFVRLKIGVGRPPGRMDPADYVLRPFTKQERPEIDVSIEEAADAVLAIAQVGLDAAMNRYNTAPRE